MLGRLHRIDGWIARIERLVALLAMSALVGILVAQVFFRYVLSSPLFFAEEVALLLLIVATFCGLSLLVFERKLVSVDLIGSLLPGRQGRLLRVAVGVLVLILAMALTVVAIRYVATPWVWSERSATVPMPRAVIQVFFAVEMTILSFHQFLALFDWLGQGIPEVGA